MKAVSVKVATVVLMTFFMAGVGALLARQAAAEVVVSIKPLHALVAGVMKGVGEPYLLIKGAASPHTYSLKPSDARKLSSARLIFWMGDRIAPALSRPLKVLPKRAKVVSLGELRLRGLTRLEVREGGLWEGHDHDHGDHHGHKDDDHKEHGRKDDDHHKDHGHKDDDHKEHGHKDDDHKDHAHKDDAHKDDHHGHKDGHHGHDELDAHLWLDPKNARVWVDFIARELGKVDPANRRKYEANSRRMARRLDALHQELARTLAQVRGVPYIVFHDAYQYFERRYGLNAIGSVTVSPEQMPGATRLVALRKKVRNTKSVCLFSEPQFRPALVATIARGTRAGTGELDPLGADTPRGEEGYFALLRNLAKSLTGCLSGKN